MSPEDEAAALAAMSPEDRAAALAAMSPEEKAAALAAMTPEEQAAAFAAMSPEDKAAAQAALAAMPTSAPTSAPTMVPYKRMSQDVTFNHIETPEDYHHEDNQKQKKVMELAYGRALGIVELINGSMVYKVHCGVISEAQRRGVTVRFHATVADLHNIALPTSGVNSTTLAHHIDRVVAHDPTYSNVTVPHHSSMSVATPTITAVNGANRNIGSASSSSGFSTVEIVLIIAAVVVALGALSFAVYVYFCHEKAHVDNNHADRENAQHSDEKSNEYATKNGHLVFTEETVPTGVATIEVDQVGIMLQDAPFEPPVATLDATDQSCLCTGYMRTKELK